MPPKPPLTAKQAIIEMAIEQFHNDGVFEIDESGVLSLSAGPDAGGCYVQGWVWVEVPEHLLLQARKEESQCPSSR